MKCRHRTATPQALVDRLLDLPNRSAGARRDADHRLAAKSASVRTTAQADRRRPRRHRPWRPELASASRARRRRPGQCSPSWRRGRYDSTYSRRIAGTHQRTASRMQCSGPCRPFKPAVPASPLPDGQIVEGRSDFGLKRGGAFVALPPSDCGRGAVSSGVSRWGDHVSEDCGGTHQRRSEARRSAHGHAPSPTACTVPVQCAASTDRRFPGSEGTSLTSPHSQSRRPQA